MSLNNAGFLSVLGSPLYGIRKVLTVGHHGVLGAVPDEDPGSPEVLHGVDAALAGQLPHDLVDVCGVGAGHLGHVGARTEDANPGNLRGGKSTHKKFLDLMSVYNFPIYLFRECDMELGGEVSAGGEAADGDGLGVDLQIVQDAALGPSASRTGGTDRIWHSY